MRVYDLIQKKKNGEELTPAELEFLVQGYTNGAIPDYQMSAFAMAVYFQSMTAAETAALTDAMARSGDTVDLSCFGDLSVDKHSTGGVGDKTTLIVAPIVASLGCQVAKMSGRGLGHTGGTVDKLEAIPGYKTTLTGEEFLTQVSEIGVAVIGQSGNLAPADKKLYALRDVTATVDSIPLIASSIMSKKLAAGSHSIVLDVKFGSGAFMKTEEDAAALARAMVDIGTECGRNVSAVLTNMDIPLGCGIGNALEVEEAMEVLRGEGPQDLRTVSVVLASHMVSLSLGITVEEAKTRVEDALDSGRALNTFRRWITAQGGDGAVCDDPSVMKRSSIIREVRAPRDGYITHMNTEKIGEAAVVLGAGRTRKEDDIDPAAGLRILKKTGDFVQAGDVLAYLHTESEKSFREGESRYLDAIEFGENAPETMPLISRVIRAEK
ncbi:MAG: pyrimidine-nucleoside phosphorylase [Clostridia bacterium]|nr:pyrimidine-nucleoside phosphorylase [Clostridia bacterium]